MVKKKGTPKTESVPQAEVAATPVRYTKRLSRSSTDKMIAGVCGGIAEYLSIDSVIVRLLFVILAISGGSGLLIYIILCIILPEKESLGKSTKDVVEENSKNLEKTIEDVASNVETIAKQRNTQTWIGFAIIVLGAFLMANNFGIVAFGDVVRIFVRTLWPLAIIAVGLVILSRNNNGK